MVVVKVFHHWRHMKMCYLVGRGGGSESLSPYNHHVRVSNSNTQVMGHWSSNVQEVQRQITELEAALTGFL